MGGGARTAVVGVTVAIRAAFLEDLPAILAIERAAFGDPWTRGMFASYLSERHKFMVAVIDDRVVGYSIARVIVDESELLNIAVEPASRGQGVGGRLLDDCMRRCADAGAVEMWLEVRTSNASARALYVTRRFSEMGVRKRYYESPREDAVLLRVALRTEGNEKVIPAGGSLNAPPDDLILSPASHHPRQEPQ